MIRKNLLFVCYCLALIMTASACEPCDDCGPQDAYPYFNLSILNKTSLDTLNTYKTRINNRLTAVNQALNNPANAPKADSLNALKAVTTDSLNLINGLISTTNARLISIQSVNGKTNLFENRNGGDSLQKFRIPINSNDNISFYEILVEFANNANQLEIGYILQDTVINDKITKAARNLRVLNHDFDSLRGPYGCSPILDCSSNELNIYVEI